MTVSFSSALVSAGKSLDPRMTGSMDVSHQKCFCAFELGRHVFRVWQIYHSLLKHISKAAGNEKAIVSRVLCRSVAQHQLTQQRDRFIVTSLLGPKSGLFPAATMQRFLAMMNVPEWRRGSASQLARCTLRVPRREQRESSAIHRHSRR